MKEILEENYVTCRTIDYYACRLFNGRQITSDGVPNWGNRVDTMVTDVKDAALRVCTQPQAEGKDQHKPTHSRETAAQENRRTCANCGKWGHWLSNCTLRKRKRERWTREKRISIGQSIGGMRQQGYQNQYHKEAKDQDEDNRNMCFRCGRRGHYASACKVQSRETMGDRIHHVSTQPQGYGRLEIKQGMSGENPLNYKRRDKDQGNAKGAE
ncbi:hypothetical protein PR048_021019 [Dryococelus australis]|uniref:CCHC-type domain-containing protein n=1 Tax=Dryococelus australis TaxID=614101 RepID=A0ABQ9GX25_9NEOP|nr:hypothetical protein PR048_021019 [Dryococelus australis]